MTAANKICHTKVLHGSVGDHNSICAPCICNTCSIKILSLLSCFFSHCMHVYVVYLCRYVCCLGLSMVLIWVNVFILVALGGHSTLNYCPYCWQFNDVQGLKYDVLKI